MHRNGTRDEAVEEQVQRKISSIHDHSELCNYLVHLMVSNSFGHTSGSQTYTQKKKQILDEMEQFFELLSTRGNDVTDTRPCKVYTRRNKTNANREKRVEGET